MPAPNAADEAIAALKTRIEQLERTSEKTAKHIAALTSDVATLVSAHKDMRSRLNHSAIKPPEPPRARRALTAAAIGVALGIGSSVWFWSLPPADSSSSAAAQSVEGVAVADQPSTPSSPVPAVAPPPVRDDSSSARSTARAPIYQGTLSIDASPPAQVFINRRPAGRTPLRLSDLKAGSHLVWLQRDGYRRFTRVVTVPADRVTRVSATLDPIASR
ncbi:MAG TPA: PEGA domain-containing protein [Vicinamibacterales bacterium]|nr:PEGA domain-containing protein [Vicinamibacterales bacterium]